MPPVGRTERTALRCRIHTIPVMTGGSIEREPEVTDWLNSLSTEEFQQVRFYVELLRDKGATL